MGDRARTLIRRASIGPAPSSVAETVKNKRKKATEEKRKEQRELEGKFERNGGVHSLAWSPDDKYLALGTHNPGNTAAIIEVESGEEKYALKRKDRVTAVEWSREGTRLAVGSWENDVTIITVASESFESFEKDDIDVPCGVSSIAWSRDDTLLAMGLWDKKQAIIKDVERHDTLYSFNMKGSVTSLMWSSDCTRLAIGSWNDKTATIIDVDNDKVLHTFKRNGSVASVAWSSDDRHLAVGSAEDETAAIIEVASGAVEHEFERKGRVTSVAWSSDDVYLAVGSSADKMAAVIHVASETVVQKFVQGGGVQSVAFSSDDMYLAVGSNDKMATIKKVASESVVHEFDQHGRVFSVAWSPVPGSSLLAASSETKRAAIIDVSKETEHVLHKFFVEGRVASVAWSADGKHLVVGSTDDKPPRAKLMDVDSGELIHPFMVDQSVKSVALSADGVYLAVGSARDNKVVVFDIHSRERVHEYERKGTVWSLSWSPDSKHLAIGSVEDRQATIIAVAGWKVEREFKAGGLVWAVAWSSSGTHLAVGSSEDQMAKVIEVATEKEVHKFVRGGAVSTVAWSSDDRYLAVGSLEDKTVAIIEVESERVVNLFELTNMVRSVAWAPDDAYLAVGGDDGKALALHNPLRAPPPSLVPLHRDALVEACTQNPSILTSHDPLIHESLLERVVDVGAVDILEPLLQLPLATMTMDERIFAMALELHDERSLTLLLVAAGSSFAPESTRNAVIKMLPLLIAAGQLSAINSAFGKLKLEEVSPLFPAISVEPHELDERNHKEKDVKALEKKVSKASEESHWSSQWKPYINKEVGADSVALRVPWKGLSSCDMLRSLLELPGSETWESEVITTMVDTIWYQEFRKIHSHAFVVYLLEVLVFGVYATGFALYAADEDQQSIMQLKDTPRGTARLVMGAMLLLFPVYFLWIECRQRVAAYTLHHHEAETRETFWESVRPSPKRRLERKQTVISEAIDIERQKSKKSWKHHSIFKRAVNKFYEMGHWNICDIVSQLAIIACIIAHFCGVPRKTILSLMAVTALPLLMKTLGFYRGFDELGWLINVGEEILKDITWFLIIIFTFVAFFAFSFVMLFSTHPCVVDYEECEGYEGGDDTAKGLVSYSRSILTMINMGLFSFYTVEGFNRTASPELTIVLFVLFMVFVTVVALNALIAILGDSFTKAKDMKTISRTKQRTDLIVEYYDVMPPGRREQLERKTQWVHQLVPESQRRRARAELEDAQNGKIQRLKIQSEVNELKLKMSTMNADLTQKLKDVLSKLDDMASKKEDQTPSKPSGAGAATGPTGPPPLGLASCTVARGIDKEDGRAVDSSDAGIGGAGTEASRAATLPALSSRQNVLPPISNSTMANADMSRVSQGRSDPEGWQGRAEAKGQTAAAGGDGGGGRRELDSIPASPGTAQPDDKRPPSASAAEAKSAAPSREGSKPAKSRQVSGPSPAKKSRK